MDKILKNFIEKPYDPKSNLWFGEQYYQEEHKSAALTLFLRAAEYSLDKNKDLTYESLIKVAGETASSIVDDLSFLFLAELNN